VSTSNPRFQRPSILVNSSEPSSSAATSSYSISRLTPVLGGQPWVWVMPIEVGIADGLVQRQSHDLLDFRFRLDETSIVQYSIRGKAMPKAIPQKGVVCRWYPPRLSLTKMSQRDSV
jgi:hypothetical protein